MRIDRSNLGSRKGVCPSFLPRDLNIEGEPLPDDPAEPHWLSWRWADSIRKRVVRHLIALIASLLCVELGAAVPELTWQRRTSPLSTNESLNAITYGMDQFIAVSDQQGHVITSPDGIVWTMQSTGVDTVLFGIAASPNLIVAVGSGGAIFTSADGRVWAQQESGTRLPLNDVTYANGRFMAVGDAGIVLHSTNGVNWAYHRTDPGNYWQSSAYGNGLHLLVGYASDSGSARSAFSSDLTNWVVRATGAGRYLSDVLFAQGQFVACGYAGLLQTCTDGTDWSLPGQASFAWLFSIAQQEGFFLAAGERGAYATSSDTIQWSRGLFPTDHTLYSVAFGRDTFVAVGQDGVIWQSSTVMTPSTILLRNVSGRPDLLQFSFTSQPRKIYRIDSAVQFPDWTRYTNLISTGTISTLVISNPPGPNRFFRVVLPNP